MTDDHSPLDPTTGPLDTGPLDDEVVSAVLDGEATAAERALVEGSVEGRARLAELRAVAAATAEPVAPLAPATVEVLLGRALDAAPTPTSLSAPVELAPRRTRRDRDERWRRWGTAVAAVAAVVVVVAGIVALGKTTGRSSSDSASSATAAGGGSASATSTTTGAGAESARAAQGVVPPNLGVLADADLVLDRYAVLVGLDPPIDHQFSGSAASGSGSAADSSSPVPAPEATAASTTACPVPPIAPAPGETWTVTATAQVPGGPVLVMANGLAPPANRVLVVDAGTCAVLAERTL